MPDHPCPSVVLVGGREVACDREQSPNRFQRHMTHRAWLADLEVQVEWGEGAAGERSGATGER